MPFECYVDHRRRRTVAVGAGVMTIEEWAHGVAQQIHEGAWRFPTVYDLTACVSMPSFDSFPKIVSDLAEVAAEQGGRGPLALVVTEAQQPIVQQYVGLAANLPYPTRMFRDRDAAHAWLDSQAGETSPPAT